MFQKIMENTCGLINFRMSDRELYDKFWKWAASWDCKESESGEGYLRGDEIGVGALWEDKSQKDFKSYL